MTVNGLLILQELVFVLLLMIGMMMEDGKIYVLNYLKMNV
jgi:hypothetical protein